MFVTNRQYCDFVCTAKDSFSERITFDKHFVDNSIFKVKILFEQLIMPEIFHWELERTLEIEKEVKGTLNQLITTICNEEKENIDPDLSDFEIDFFIGS